MASRTTKIISPIFAICIFIFIILFVNDEAREYTATEAKVAHWTRNKNWGEIVKLHQDCSQLSEEEQLRNGECIKELLIRMRVNAPTEVKSIIQFEDKINNTNSKGCAFEIIYQSNIKAYFKPCSVISTPLQLKNFDNTSLALLSVLNQQISPIISTRIDPRALVQDVRKITEMTDLIDSLFARCGGRNDLNKKRIKGCLIYWSDYVEDSLLRDYNLTIFHLLPYLHCHPVALID